MFRERKVIMCEPASSDKEYTETGRKAGDEDRGDIQADMHAEAKGASSDQDITMGETILEGLVTVGGKQKCLRLTSDGLCLCTQTSESKKGKDDCLNLKWCDIIRAESDPKASSSSHNQNAAFVIHYIHHRPNYILRPHCLRLEYKDGHAEKWINAIHKQCQGVSGRPKKVFVVINPIGGACKGQQIYDKTVRPLLELAEIHTTVVVTEKSKHALEIGETQDFDSYDGIVLVGGDGIFHEVLSGLTFQHQRRTGVDYNNPDTQLEPLHKPFAIIAAGTGNGVTNWMNLTKDVESATLNIIRGEQHRAQVFTVHSQSKLVCVCGLQYGYGRLADIIKRTDDLRWMGRARYPYAIMGSLFKKTRMFPCEVEYLQADGEAAQGGGDGSDNMGDSKVAKEDQPQAGTQWIKHSKDGRKYSGIFSFACGQQDIGNKYIANPFSSTMSLILDSGTSQLAMWKYMLHFVTGKEASSTSPTFDVIPKVIGCRVKLIQDEGSGQGGGARSREAELELMMNIDGEVVYLDTPEMDVRVRANFVPMYSRARPTSVLAK